VLLAVDREPVGCGCLRDRSSTESLGVALCTCTICTTLAQLVSDEVVRLDDVTDCVAAEDRLLRASTCCVTLVDSDVVTERKSQ